MPSLLDLPRELRDEILNHVVSFPVDIPTDTKLARRRRADHSRWLGGHNVFMLSSDEAFRPPVYSLLHTCKQLYAETMRCLSKSEQVLILDLAFIDTIWLLPTWRYIVPQTTRLVDHLIINLSLANSEYAEQIQPQVARGGSRGSPEALWGFIHRFLAVGPVGDVQSNSKDLNIRVKVLTMKVDLPRYTAGLHVFSKDEIPGRVFDGMAHLNHEILTSVQSSTRYPVFHWVEKVVAMTRSQFHGHSPYAPFGYIQERIDKIIISVNGEPLALK